MIIDIGQTVYLLHHKKWHDLSIVAQGPGPPEWEAHPLLWHGVLPVYNAPGSYLRLAVSTGCTGPPALQQSPGGSRPHRSDHRTLHHLRPLDTGTVLHPIKSRFIFLFWNNVVWPKMYITVFFKIIPVSQYMTVFIFFMHNRVLTTFSTGSRLTYNAIF